MDNQEYTLYVFLRNLDISTGKKFSQVIHASISSFINSNPNTVSIWKSKGGRTIVLESRNDQEYNSLKNILKSYNLRYFPIIDSGLTYVKPNTQTCFSIQILDRSKFYDKIFKYYKLL
jgi:peptidyl-tRNA hydrolase